MPEANKTYTKCRPDVFARSWPFFATRTLTEGGLKRPLNANPEIRAGWIVRPKTRSARLRVCVCVWVGVYRHGAKALGACGQAL